MFRELTLQIKPLLDRKNPPIILIFGLRQTGKSTLVRNLCENKKSHIFNFDLASDKQEFMENTRHSLDLFAKKLKNQVIIIDEVQKLSESTSIIKHLYDQYKLSFLLTGSSELKIKKNMGDSLAGRTRTFKLYPLSTREIAVQNGQTEPGESLSYDQAQTIMQKYLVYGSLPNLENIPPEDYIPFLKDFVDNLLSKDVLEIAGIKKSTKIFTLARLLAMQTGQLVNINEISTNTELTRPTVYSYLDILEQLNIIQRSYPLSTNERQAISEKFKVYFTDCGIRNSLINNFEPLQIRLDKGFLLENAVFVGIKRTLDYQNIIYSLGFFRSHTKSEIDIVLKKDNKEYLYEVKTSKKYLTKKGKIKYITLENAPEFL